MINPDDRAAFLAAVADAKPLPSDNRVHLPPAPVRRIARPQPSNKPARQGKKIPDDSLPAHWRAPGQPQRPPPTDPEEAALWQAMSGVHPLLPSNRVILAPPPPAPRPQHSLADERAALHESLHGPIGLQDRLEGGDEAHYLRNGLAATVLRDLRRGRWVLQGELDLHGLNREEARLALAHFLADSLHQGRRCIRVVTGKGLRSPQKLSILRQLVRGWLAQRNEVLAYCQARPCDGGDGALLVLLRSPKKQRAT
ncbi:MAG: Smr/MutS family protein [Dechloromonas sp.]|nr:Smr/MutS family protein [Dechloromonas sp.]